MEPAKGDARLLTVKEAATYLASTVWFVRSLAWERRVPFLKLGKRVCFDRVDLDKFIEQEKSATKKTAEYDNILRPGNHETPATARVRPLGDVSFVPAQKQVRQ
ncbi:MAG: excisionase family DNA-binding protein [Acidobacteriia bacterium]|nr:excisionase family DNA-binding protein [Terriglobia bacterium]